MLFVLLDFSPIKPDLGLILWTTAIFLLFWFILGKMAFKPIAEALKNRENNIQGALDEAKKAREEMASMQADNDKLLAEAREERSKIIREAKESGNKMVAEAKEKAKAESNKIISEARLEIENQRSAALTEAKNKVGVMAIEIAEKVIRKELQNNQEHQDFVNSLVDEINLS
jgi:F-type H+-transporting ATPase subunit b